MEKEQMKKKEMTRKKNTGATEVFPIRLTTEEKIWLREHSAERNVDMSTYVREKVFSNAQVSIYDKKIAQILYNITELLTDRVELHCNNPEFIFECERSAAELWRYLK